MTQAPTIFADPLVKPVKFTQILPKAVFAFGESSFPVSFSFREDPRPAVFLKAAATQLGIVFTDKEAHVPPVVQFATGSSQTFELHANGKDVTTAEFFLKVPTTDGGIISFMGYDVAEVRQPSFDADIVHTFKNGGSTVGFDGVNYGGDLYYPAATMRISVMPTLVGNDEWAQVPASTDPGGSTQVTIAPAGAFGVVDVKIDVDVKWYEDPERRHETTVVPEDTNPPCFGVRFFVSRAGKFSTKTTLSRGVCTVGSLYPTAVLRSLGGDSVRLAYWGRGADGNGLFWGREDGIEVSSNGLAIQEGVETASYILPNPLDDYDSSSSSISSASSPDSTSSSSSGLNTSSQSTSSSTSESTISSKSTSSWSSKSYSSSSSSSISSLSSATSTSSSSSTAAEVMTTSSSDIAGSGMTSSSSLVASILARYGFAVAPTAEGIVVDDSGNGNDLSVGPVGGGLGPPVWGPAYGRSGGGGFRFTADGTNSEYLSMSRQPWANARGSISIWARTFGTGNGSMVPFCASNGSVSLKTELAVSIDVSSGEEKVLAWVMVDGVAMWMASTPASSFTSGVWHNVVLTHDGTEPKAYIDGVSSALTFSDQVDKTAWLSSLSGASMVVVGAAPRYYSPYMALGFYGLLDEITLWDEALSADDVDAIYHSTEA